MSPTKLSAQKKIKLCQRGLEAEYVGCQKYQKWKEDHILIIVRIKYSLFIINEHNNW